MCKLTGTFSLYTISPNFLVCCLYQPSLVAVPPESTSEKMQYLYINSHQVIEGTEVLRHLATLHSTLLIVGCQLKFVLEHSSSQSHLALHQISPTSFFLLLQTKRSQNLGALNRNKSSTPTRLAQSSRKVCQNPFPLVVSRQDQRVTFTGI